MVYTQIISYPCDRNTHLQIHVYGELDPNKRIYIGKIAKMDLYIQD